MMNKVFEQYFQHGSDVDLIVANIKADGDQADYICKDHIDSLVPALAVYGFNSRFLQEVWEGSH